MVKKATEPGHGPAGLSKAHDGSDVFWSGLAFNHRTKGVKHTPDLKAKP